MTISYALDVKAPLMVSDGASAGGPFDRLTVLENDLPYVPASSIRGCVKATLKKLISDALGRWPKLWTCHNGDSACSSQASIDQRCPLCRIFGAPGSIQRGFTFSGAYYSNEARLHIEQAFPGRQAITVNIVRRVRNKYDVHLRRAREDHLFVDGVAAFMSSLSGTIQESPVHASYPADIRDFDLSFLLLGLRLTTRLGAGRNRGYGYANFVLSQPMDWQNKIKFFTDSWNTGIAGGS
ncbi:MAG: hypothetical protein HQK55_05560 [Deltaproteobacteria bacterium]|nr:hypothetical protein [Deltaproteobacteria bacterium]